MSLCRRAASVEIALEQMDAEMSGGFEVDRDEYNRLTENLVSILERLDRSHPVTA